MDDAIRVEKGEALSHVKADAHLLVVRDRLTGAFKKFGQATVHQFQENDRGARGMVPVDTQVEDEVGVSYGTEVIHLLLELLKGRHRMVFFQDRLAMGHGTVAAVLNDLGSTVETIAFGSTDDSVWPRRTESTVFEQLYDPKAVRHH